MSAFIQKTAFVATESSQQLGQDAKVPSLLEFNQSTFLKGVLESLADGILILDQEGKLIHANSQGIYHYQRFNNSLNSDQVPQEILQVRDALLECRRLFPRRGMVIESGISTKDGKNLRLRGRWLSLSESAPDYILITIEDCQNSRHSLISANRRKYGFTAREAEIWSLRRAKYSYKQIAAKLYISENTVKKHIKSINAKRKQTSAGKGKFFTATVGCE